MSTIDTEPESSLAISVRPPSAKIASSTSARPIESGFPARRPVATSQIPTVPGAPGTAIRFESGLKEIDCAPPPGGFVSIGAAITRPLTASQRVTWLSSCPPAAITEPSGLYRTMESGAARGPASSRRRLLRSTSHSSTLPSPPAIASVRPSGLKSAPSQAPCDDRSGGPSGFHVAVSQSVVPASVTVARRLPSGLNAVAFTGESNPLSQAWIQDPCSSAPRSAPRASPLDQREGPGDQRRHQRGRDGREQTAQAPGPAPCASQLPVLGVPARLQELAFDPRELPLAVRHFDGGGQAGPAIKVGLLAPRLLPSAGGGRQLAFGSERFPIVRQPPAEPRPLPDQRLVGDLGGVVTHDQEAGACEPLEDRGRLRAALALRDELRKRNAPAGVLRRLAELGELEQHPPHQRLLLGAAAQEDLLRRMGDRAADTARRLVARAGQDAALPAGPRLVEGMGEQRKGAGLAFDLGEHRVDQAGLES